MRLLAALGLLLFVATATPALAQVHIDAKMGREGNDYLLYERTDMLVTVTIILELGDGIMASMAWRR